MAIHSSVALRLGLIGLCAVVTAQPWFAAPHAQARAFYVANTGNDAAAGDATHPWRTMARVAQQPMDAGDTLYLTAGDTWTAPLLVKAAGASCVGGKMKGDFERIAINPGTGTVAVEGWVVDPLLGNGTAPSNVSVWIDGTPAAYAVANVYREDLVKAGVAPNPNHGFDILLGTNATTFLRHGNHTVAVVASSAAVQCGPYSWRPPGPILSEGCVCNGKLCPCPPARVDPVHVRSTNATAKRPTIKLGGAGTAITFAGFASMSVTGIEIVDADEGVVARGATPPASGGTARVADCVFRGVWNRSSIGQADPNAVGRDCANGWTKAVSLGSFASAVVVGNLFDDVDQAFAPGAGGLTLVWFLRNTVTRANGNTVMMVGQSTWLIDGNVFSRNTATRFFMCGTTDIMIGGLGTYGTISNNEIGWRGEHPAAPDGCGIDFEGGSESVAVVDNVIHDSFGAGVMVFGLSDPSRNISNATLRRNVFVRNGAEQTSDDHGEVSFMEHGSTGTCSDNVFFASDTAADFVLHEVRNGTLKCGWDVANNTIYGVGDIPYHIPDTPAMMNIVFAADTGFAHVKLMSRLAQHNHTVLWSIDGSLPRWGQPGTNAAFLPSWHGSTPFVEVVVPRTSALNVRFLRDGMVLPSLTMTTTVLVPASG